MEQPFVIPVTAGSAVRALCFIVISFFCNLVIAQINVKEHVTMHLSNDQLVTGETLYFSASVVSSETNKFSTLSNILYVELINEKGEPIHQAKQNVRNGKAYGEIFIESLIGSGCYQLIAYTRWMKNFGDFFHYPIQIINPFETYEIKPPSQKLTVNFFPEGGNLIEDKSNHLVVEVIINDEPAALLQGRLLDDEGNVLSSFSTSSLGLTRLEYTPLRGTGYQIVLEDLEGDFQFFPIPVASNKHYSLQVTHKGANLDFQVLGRDRAPAQVEVFHGTSLLLSLQSEVNQLQSLAKDKLPPGVSLLIARLDGEIVSKRVVYNQPKKDMAVSKDTLTFAQRSLVSIPLASLEALNASISVRKVEYNRRIGLGAQGLDLLYGIDDFTRFEEKWLFDPYYLETMDQLLILSKWKLSSAEMPKTVRFLPDHRGEIISGRIRPQDSIFNSKRKIAYSLIGSDYQVKVGEADSTGYFSMIITPFGEDRTAFITSLDQISADLIEIDEPFMNNYPSLTYPREYLDSTAIKQVVERSIRNQIENAYYQVKKDSVLNNPGYPEEFGQFDYFYVLDDLNRFSTIKDSFVEYIPTVAVRNKLDKRVFKIAPKNVLSKPDFTPFVLLDGLPVVADDVLKFSPYRIESIGVINNRYFFGPMIFDGIVSFRTKRGDLHGFEPNDYTRSLDYKGLSPLIEYQFPSYDSSNLAENNLRSRIPDYRDQLFWDPNLIIQPNGSSSIQFYTSDTKGTFEISVEGISEQGEMISIRKYITVE